MTNEEKQLLLQDLCRRLSYGVKVQVCNLKDYAPTVKGLLNDELYVQFDYITKPIKNGDSTYNIINDNVKPYLRSMSSMTEEEKRYIHNKFGATNYGSIETYSFESFEGGHSEVCMVDMIGFIDWLNAHHFDYRGLINKGLALPAPEGMYNN